MKHPMMLARLARAETELRQFVTQCDRWLRQAFSAACRFAIRRVTKQAAEPAANSSVSPVCVTQAVFGALDPAIEELQLSDAHVVVGSTNPNHFLRDLLAVREHVEEAHLEAAINAARQAPGYDMDEDPFQKVS